MLMRIAQGEEAQLSTSGTAHKAPSWYLSCLLTLYTAVMSFEILFPFGLWVFEPGCPDKESMAWDVTAGAPRSKRLPGHTRIRLQQPNPKKRGFKSYERYDRYMNATTVSEYFQKGGRPEDLL